MTDYGHDLIFGTFLTPRSARPEDVIALARLTERVELDLVTFQDHPYQPAFLDTWTLLSYVAACTERVRLAGNVLNLPLRPPAVLARAAASLDLLSSGRFELGLGSGSFWEAIAAMGGPRRSPLPSLSYLQPGDLRRGNEAIDEAAAAAGRDPRRVRRLLNIGLGDDGTLAGPPAEWAERLLPFAVEDGVSGFILAADEPGPIEAWGQEAAPALRAAVARERALPPRFGGDGPGGAAGVGPQPGDPGQGRPRSR